MVGGLFGVHTIDMGMCSSFTRGSTSERRKALFYYLFLWEGCCRVSKFSFFLFISFAVYSYHVLLSFLLSFLWCVHCMASFSCKVGMARTYVCFGNSF